jgi:hypothetical protein
VKLWSQREKGLIDLHLHIKCKQVQKIATFHNWQGKEALSIQKQGWNAAWILLPEQCKSLDDIEPVTRVASAMGPGSANHKILLLQDNLSGHIVPDGLQSIHVKNLTAHVQPMDQGII